MKHILIFLTLLISTIASAEMTLPPKASERQYLKKEWLKDPSFEIGGGVTTSEASTSSYQTAWSTNTVTGRSISWNPSTSGTLTLSNYIQSNGTEFTVRANSSGSLRGSCLVNGNDSTHTYTIEIYDVTNAAIVKSEALVIGDSGSWNFQQVKTNVTPTSDTLYRLRLQATANEANIYIDDCTFGFEEGIQAVNVNQVFSALVTDGSSTTTVSRETSDWISGNCTNGSAGNYTCTLVSGFFNEIPNCQVTGVSSSPADVSCLANATSNTSVSVGCRNQSNTTNADRTFVLSCQRSEPNSGFAVRMDQTNYGPISYTPTFGGMGTVTSIDMKHERNGAFMHIFGNFTTGTASGSTASMTLPSGPTISSSYATITGVGRAIAGTGSAVGSKDASVLATAAGTLLNFSVVGTSAVNPLTAQTGTTAINDSTKYSIDVWVQIQGWTANQNAPLIIGGVTSSYAGTIRTEVANINCDAGSAITSQLGTWVASAGNVSAGACAVGLTSGIFSSAPYCDVTSTGLANPNVALSVVSATTSTVTVDCDGSATGTDCAAYDFNLTCTGPR